jgi:hypothetical protein
MRCSKKTKKKHRCLKKIVQKKKKNVQKEISASQIAKLLLSRFGFNSEHVSVVDKRELNDKSQLKRIFQTAFKLNYLRSSTNI